MFEQDHKIVESLLDKDKNFRRLFNKHCQLKSKVREANEGYLGISDFDLEVLKKEKLTTRDSRSVERKKPGRAKARRSYQFSKR